MKSFAAFSPGLRALWPVLALVLAGCSSVDGEPLPVTPAAAPVSGNHLGEVRMPVEVRRVVLLPIQGGGLVPPETLAVLDPVFAAALQQHRRFEVVSASRTWCRRTFGQEAFSSAEALPHDFLGAIAREYAADAVLFVDLTAYQDYRPLTLGVRAKLALVSDRRLVWTFDEILSGADQAVAASAQLHARAGDRSDLPVSLNASVLQSPSRFADFVADRVFGTLPPR